MKKTLFLLCCLFSQSAFTVDIDWTKSNIAVANRHILPAYKSLAKKTDRLARDALALCNQGDTEKLQKRFLKVQLAWASIEHIRFGPIEFLHRYERFNYWPDKHNVGSRQIRKLIQGIEGQSDSISSNLLTIINLSGKSVAVQGLPAMEKLLYKKSNNGEKGELTKGECYVVSLIVENINSIASKVDLAWRTQPIDFSNEFVLAKDGLGSYESSEEITNKLLNNINTAFVLIALKKINDSLPKSEVKKARAYPRKLQAWRSKMSLPILKQNLFALRKLYLIGFAKQTKKVDKKLHSTIKKQFRSTLKSAKKIKQPLVLALKTTEGVEQIRSLLAQAEDLQALIKQMQSILGLAQSFNSLDGD